MSKNLLRAGDIKAMPEIETHHQFNDNAIRHSKSLTADTGMQRIGIHLVRLESGRDSTTHHFHDADEEFVYILSGHGIAKIDDTEYAVGPGDFMGFSAPSAAHSLHNPHTPQGVDLVYLMGGERWASDVVHYPDIRRTMIKSHGKRRWAAWDDFEELPPRP